MKSINYIVSSKSKEWITPEKIFKPLHKIFNFDVDLCANILNRKVDQFFDVNDNCLVQEWTFKTGWLNPPYSKPSKQEPLNGTGKYIKKAFEQVYIEKNIKTVLILIPNNTEAKHYHDFIFKGHSLLFYRGRIGFIVNGEPMNKNTRGSTLIIFSRLKLDRELKELEKHDFGAILKLNNKGFWDHSKDDN